MNLRQTHLLGIVIVTILMVSPAFSQTVFWTEDFQNNCDRGCDANAYTGGNGAWTETLLSGGNGNGTDANRWYVSGRACGNTTGACASRCGTTDPSLHVGNDFYPGLDLIIIQVPSANPDSDAVYLADSPGLSGIDTRTDKRIESPVINCTGRSGVILSFNYIENGQGSIDNAELWYNDGGGWQLLEDLDKTSLCGAGIGRWTAYSTLIPWADNNANVQIGFRWYNNADDQGNDPSFAVDDIILVVPDVCSPTTGPVQSVSQCNAFVSPNTGNVFSTTGLHRDTLTGVNAQGCDSIVPIQLTILSDGDTTITVSACNSYTAPSGKVLTSTGTHLDTIANNTPGGCDTVTTIQLTIFGGRTTMTASTCGESYTSPSGRHTWKASGQYEDTLSSQLLGCDSIVVVDLTIVSNVDTTVVAQSYSAEAQAVGASFQWINCDSSFVVVVGDTSATIAPQVDGRYAVIVNQSGCVDTSACYALEALTSCFADVRVPNAFSPNGDGINDLFHIEGLENCLDHHLQIFTRWGVKVLDDSPYLNNWDGIRENGNNLPPAGSYYYVLTLTDALQQEEVRTGFVIAEY